MKYLLSIVPLVGTLLLLSGADGASLPRMQARNTLYRRQGQPEPNVTETLTDPDGKQMTISDLSKYSHQKFGNYVIDRKTGRLSYEFVPTEVRTALVSTFAVPSIATSKLSRNFLRKMTLKKGTEMNDPSSAKEISRFVSKYRIDMNEYKQKDLSKYSTFNEFFSREIDLNLRPVEGGPNTFTSAADSRLMVFETAQEATSLWVKGRHFSVSKMLNLETPDTGYENATMSIFRLAPQDYHRYHSPVDGKVISIRDIAGEYYTVNPIAVRSNIDVFTENHRVIIEIQRSNGEKIAFVCVGATLVGSVKLSVAVGTEVKRGDEIGTFLYGGSTVVVFAKGLKFDQKLLSHSYNQVETLVTVRSIIGEWLS